VITHEEWHRRLGEAAKKASDKRNEMHRVLNGNSTGDQAFDGIIGFCSALSAMRDEAGKMKREIQAEKRKQRYAIRKQLGLVKTAAQRKAEKAAKLAEEREDQRLRDAWEPDSCYCWQGHPPCTWCLDPKNDPDYREEPAT